MNELQQRMIEEIKKSIDKELNQKVSAEVLETVASALYGPTQPMVQDDASSTLVSTGIDAIVGQIQAAVRIALTSRLREEGA